MIEVEGDFIPPPEAPVFEPTWEEFQDPLGYICKIKPIAERTGICKIKPPSDWQPPFAVDVDTFTFTPRVQRLNELEAKTRVKLNFLDKLAKFWELQGNSLRIPNVERKLLDLYSLSKIVNEEGGFELVTKERKWSKVASRMGYPPAKNVGSTLRAHYERVLFPYDIFSSGATIDPAELKSELESMQKLKKEPGPVEEDGDPAVAPEEGGDRDYKPHGLAQREAQGAYSRRSKRIMKENYQQPAVDYESNKELKKLQFYGAGPKAALPDLGEGEEETPAAEPEQVEEKPNAAPSATKKTRMKTRDKRVSYVDSYMCHTCSKGDGEDHMLLCDGCDDAYHTYCLIPPMQEIPKGDWRCPKCVAKECGKPQEAYGFEQAKRTYTLQSYGEMADQFKLDYFNMPVHMVPCSTVEREFWRLVNSVEEDVLVEYGADIHAADCGSGFPTRSTESLFPDDEEYINSGWNLNNLPVLDASVMRHINADISGMKIPWCYVGMCFSCFCWHTEDHWSYSINYMHWGEPKTWYGVPGAKAELLEECMRKNAPELFEQSPDLLHQLTTIMNPNILMAYGVPIFRTNQHAGEFIVTFPRAYHAGFNQGYNFAEAVNFCPADWLPIGRGCVDHYQHLKRQCVFSHEELVCKMAAEPERLDVNLAAATHQDMLSMVEAEKKHRKRLFDLGVVEAKREAFELLQDDERQCFLCKTTCFLSAVTCACSPSMVSCCLHAEDLCECKMNKRCLRYRYTLDELPNMLHKLKIRAESYDNWAFKVKKALEATKDQKLDLPDLKELLTEAEDKKFPDSPLLQQLGSAVGEAEKCASVANQLVSAKVRTRHRQSVESKYVAKLNLDELERFSEQVDSLPCSIKESGLIQELLKKVRAFQAEAREALDADEPDSNALAKLMEVGMTLDIDLPELPKLKQILHQARWLDEVRDTVLDSSGVTLEVMRRLIESGVGLVPHPACEKAMAELQELLNLSERWEEKARVCLQARPRHVVTTLEAIINEAKDIPAYLPNIASLKEAVRKAKEWTQKVDVVQNAEHYPYLDVLEAFVNKGRPIPVRLDALPQVESQVAAAKSWRERTARTFLKKNSTFSLVEVLSPRTDIGMYLTGKNKRRKQRDSTGHDREKENAAAAASAANLDVREDEVRDPAAMVAAFKQAERTEVNTMIDLRVRNLSKAKLERAQDARYCTCRKGPVGFMLQCELCKDWFHSTCVPLPKAANLKNKSSTAALVQAARDLKFLCPQCLRSRRPRLETILSLLVSLQKLPVRLPEGEALQCLTERAMAWQDRARQALATDELASALAKLSVLSQRMVEQAAREKTEKIIHAELQKAASNPELQGHLQSVQHSAFTVNGNTVNGNVMMDTSDGVAPPPVAVEQEVSGAALAGGVPVAPSPAPSDDTTPSEVESDSMQVAVGMSEHAYSSASKPSITGSPRRPRKSPLVPRAVECAAPPAPVLELSEDARLQLEALMMEGDLLEVSLDETQHIWRILQACQPPAAPDKLLEFQELESDILKERVEKVGDAGRELFMDLDKKEKKKRRKKESAEGGDKDQDPVKVKRKKLKDKDGKVKKKDKEGKKDEKEKKKRKKKDDKKKAQLDEDDDMCSALKCLKPTGTEVNWVQCDVCEEWFHLLCIGIGEDEISETEDYVCYKCRRRAAAAAGAVPEGAATATPPAAAHAPQVQPQQRRHFTDPIAPLMMAIQDDLMGEPSGGSSDENVPPAAAPHTSAYTTAATATSRNPDTEDDSDDDDDDDALVISGVGAPSGAGMLPRKNADSVSEVSNTVVEYSQQRAQTGLAPHQS